MKRLRELKIKYAAEMGVSAAFMDDKFYLFLNGAKNRFETTIFSLPPSLYDGKQIKKKMTTLFLLPPSLYDGKQIKKKISKLLLIIDELNLSLDIFK